MANDSIDRGMNQRREGNSFIRIYSDSQSKVVRVSTSLSFRFVVDLRYPPSSWWSLVVGESARHLPCACILRPPYQSIAESPKVLGHKHNAFKRMKSLNVRRLSEIV